MKKEKESAKIIGQSNISLSSDEQNPDPNQDQGVEFSSTVNQILK